MKSKDIEKSLDSLKDLEDSSLWSQADIDAVSETDLDNEGETLSREMFGAAASASTVARYEEKCFKCRGSGRFVSYAGRDVGPCHRCKGTGTLTYKTSPEQRQRTRVRAQDRKQAKHDAKAQRVQDWLAANPERAKFLEQDWEFPVSLRAGLDKYGSLTDNQLAAIDRSIAKQATRREERAALDTDLDLTDLPGGMYAVPGGDTRLKIRVNKPRAGTKWAGWTFVDDGAEYGQRQKYGSQRPGGLYNGKLTDQLRAIMADPFEASKAYGKLVGRCGVCGRHLEDEVSVANGIGPICAAKFS
jgi:hypothetical protein